MVIAAAIEQTVPAVCCSGKICISKVTVGVVMFRESDLKTKNVHSTYTNKPIPVLQLQAQSVKLDDSGLANSTYKKYEDLNEVAPIPTTWDTYYDPAHPDSDWSGLVSTTNKHRKHTTDHVSQQSGLVHSELGLVSKVERQEWAHKRVSENGRYANQASLVLGGIDCGSDRFKTTHQSFENQEKTDRNQLTLEKRIRPMKAIPDPCQSSSQHNKLKDAANHVHNTENLQSGNISHGASSLAGYRGPAASRSLLTSLGSDIAAKVNTPTFNSAQPIQRGTHPDTLLSQNYNPMPGEYLNNRVVLSHCAAGYTGRRYK